MYIHVIYAGSVFLGHPVCHLENVFQWVFFYEKEADSVAKPAHLFSLAMQVLNIIYYSFL